MQLGIPRLLAAVAAASFCAVVVGCASAPGDDEATSTDDEELAQSLPPLEHATGALVSPDSRGTPDATPTSYGDDALPAHFDWAERGYVTPAKNQGPCGSCWAFATTAAAESAMLIAQRKTYQQQPVDLSEQWLISCSYEHTSWSEPKTWPHYFDVSERGCHGGGSDIAASWIVQHGLVTEAHDRYQAQNGTCNASLKPDAHVAQWGYARPMTNDDLLNRALADLFSLRAGTEHLKRALVQYGPVVTGLYASHAFETYKTGVFAGHNDFTNHQVLIVGWDDAKQAFHVKNSWGAGWGDHGYGWIRYDTTSIGAGAVWIKL